jgi:alanyl-tRNA synthetase
VARTGAIGIIATSRWEKMRGGTRIEFVCGGRALARFREWRDIVTSLTRTLSVTPGELQDSVDRLHADLKGSQRAGRMFQEQLAIHEGRALLARAEPVAERLVVVEVLDGWDAAGLKALAAAATLAEPRAAVALFSRSSPALAVVARGAAVPVDASAVVKTLHSRFGGRGGGKPELAQGGGLLATEPDLVAAARDALGG